MKKDRTTLTLASQLLDIHDMNDHLLPSGFRGPALRLSETGKEGKGKQERIGGREGVVQF